MMAGVLRIGGVLITYNIRNVMFIGTINSTVGVG